MDSPWALLALALALPQLAASSFTDPASLLARTLAEKGTITPAELATIESADGQKQAGLLAGMLQQKGLLTAAEVARLSGSAQAAPPAVRW